MGGAWRGILEVWPRALTWKEQDFRRCQGS